MPFVTPSISAAAVNRRGELWISLSVPHVLHDNDGDKSARCSSRPQASLLHKSLLRPGWPSARHAGMLRVRPR